MQSHQRFLGVLMHMKYSQSSLEASDFLWMAVLMSPRCLMMNPWDLIRITSAQYLNTSDAVQFSDDVNAAIQNKIKNTPFLFTSLGNDQLNYWFSFHIDRLLALPLLLITSVLFPPKQTLHPQIHSLTCLLAFIQIRCFFMELFSSICKMFFLHAMIWTCRDCKG